jgi:hypothetical protein
LFGRSELDHACESFMQRRFGVQVRSVEGWAILLWFSVLGRHMFSDCPVHRIGLTQAQCVPPHILRWLQSVTCGRRLVTLQQGEPTL